MTVRILGIETSCDETAAAVVEEGSAIISNVVASQNEIHAQAQKSRSWLSFPSLLQPNRQCLISKEI